MSNPSHLVISRLLHFLYAKESMYVHRFIICLLLFSFAFVIPACASNPESMNVSAVVPPNASDLQLHVTETTIPTTIEPDALLSYEITYGVKQSAGINSDVTLVANWSGTSAPDGTQMAEYVPQSATNAYGQTPPVIDMINRTISWYIPSLPAGTTDQKVTFQVQITKNFLHEANLSWNIRVNMYHPYITLPDALTTNTYHYIPPPQSINNDTTTTTSSQQTTSNQQPTPIPKKIESSTGPVIFLNTITDNEVQITAVSKKPKKIIFRYGKSLNALSQTITLAPDANLSNLNLENLLPSTSYFFEVTTVDQNNQSSTSDIQTFKTAETSAAPSVENNVSVITSNGSILVSDAKGTNGNKTPIALIETNTPYEIRYTLKQPLHLKSIDAVVRSKVLGSQTSKVLGANEFIIPMQEKEPGIYIANLQALTPGTFEIFVRMVDGNGNLKEEKIAEAKIMPHFLVSEEGTDQPIQDARVFLYYYNNKAKRYEPLSRELFKGIRNPQYTDAQGALDLALTQGKYKAEISAFGHDSKTIQFTLGANPGEEYPKIFLKKNVNSVGNFLTYYQQAGIDILNNILRFINSLAFSLRFFNLIATSILGSLIFITTFLFLRRTHMRIRHIPRYFLHHLHVSFNKNLPNSFFGTVVDETGKSITQVMIEVSNHHTGQVLSQLHTNKNGRFYLQTQEINEAHKIRFSKEGFAPVFLLLNKETLRDTGNLTITMHKQLEHRSLPRQAVRLTEDIADFLFEFVLMWTLIIECFFCYLFGFLHTAPFLLISLFNMLLWMYFLRERLETEK